VKKSKPKIILIHVYFQFLSMFDESILVSFLFDDGGGIFKYIQLSLFT